MRFSIAQNGVTNNESEGEGLFSFFAGGIVKLFPALVFIQGFLRQG